jgi:hypothetical protein
MNQTEPMTKKLLGQKYGLSPQMVKYYLNSHFIEDLEAVGYSKEMRILPPKVVRKFVELFGEPLTNDEI